MANRYWVGGTGNITDLAHWSSVSGAAGGASVPTSADNAIFDSKSFTATGQTVTINAAFNCLDFDWTNVAVGASFVPTLAGNATFNIYGSFILSSGMTYNFTGGLSFLATTTGKIIDVHGKTILNDMTFGSSGGLKLTSDLITQGYIFHNGGTLDTNGSIVTLTAGNFISNTSNPRTLTLGASTINVAGNWQLSTTTGLTLNAGSSTIDMTGSASAFFGGGLTYNQVGFRGASSTVHQSNTINALYISAGKTVNFDAGTTQTITSLLSSGSIGNLSKIQSTTAGSPFILRKTSGTVTFDYFYIKDCTATGGATFQATNSTDGGNNTGWLGFATITTQYWNGTAWFRSQTLQYWSGTAWALIKAIKRWDGTSWVNPK